MLTAGRSEAPIMTQPKYPAGWDEERVRRVLAHYEEQSNEGAVAERGLEYLEAQGCPFVVVIGHPEFYPRFGFDSAPAYGLTCDWELPAGVFMVTVLNAAAAGRVHGHVAYRAEFATAT